MSQDYEEFLDHNQAQIPPGYLCFMSAEELREMIKEAINKLVDGQSLTGDEIFHAMEEIMNGCASPAQIASLITALRMKGETVEEITGGALAMRSFAQTIKPQKDHLVDTCGTGGDGANSFNISTTAAFIVAGAGLPVAKHGNRSVSSRCGSADVLEALNIRIDLSPQQVQKCIEEIGIGFLFAPQFHQAMRHAVGPRKDIGIRTIFNLLGPLANPANAQHQLVGVYKYDLTHPIALVLGNLGLESAIVVHGAGGLDEISICGPSQLSILKNGQVTTTVLNPQDYGIPLVDKKAIQGGDPHSNAQFTLNVLQGKRGPHRDVSVLNAAAAIFIAQKDISFADALALAQESIDSANALAKLEALQNLTKRCEDHDLRQNTCA